MTSNLRPKHVTLYEHWWLYQLQHVKKLPYNVQLH